MRLLFTTVVVLCLLGTACDRRPAVDKRLCEAIYVGDTNLLLQFLNGGGDVNKAVQYMPHGHGSAPLLDIALKYGQTNMLDMLLRNDADPNQQDSRGDTPLLWAIGRSGGAPDVNLQMVKRLLKAGADPNLRSSERYGWTPLIEASELGQTEIVKVLLRAGANVNATNNEGLTAIQFADNGAIAELLVAAGASLTERTGGETAIESAIRRGKYDVLAVLTNQNRGNK